ncbi:S8 family peptidase [Vibrio navarrensis]
MTKESNPIKHVEFSPTDYKPTEPNRGGNNSPLKKVTAEFRAALLSSLDVVDKQLIAGKKSTGLDVCTAVVELESNATAKSHRPTDLFNEKTCPFFGDAGYGRMLIQISSQGITRLKRKISSTNSKSGIKALSAIKSISQYEAPIEQPSNSNSGIVVRLFRFNDPKLNAEIDVSFEKTLNQLGCKWIKHRSQSVRLYKVNSNISLLLSMVPTLVTVQSAIVSNSIKLQPMNSKGIEMEMADVASPDPLHEYPLVGVVDSGVSATCKPLSDWVVGYNRKVPEPFRDLNHGTFVSGMISNPYLYNKDSRFPKCQSKIVSVEVLGDNIGDIFDIVNAMYETAEQYPEIKVWNLSLGSPEAVSLYEISAMALMLDEFQDKFNCLCVIAAGNYVKEMRPWPPTSKKLDDGISSPGDSVRGLTVGSIAHIDGHVQNEQPSPFSRKGPVSNYVQKPDIVHFGGNTVEVGGTHIPLGVNSICPNGMKRNDIGTSYATPIISNLAANLFQQLGDRATPNLVKALLIHNANMGIGAFVKDEHRPYFGWGLPGDIPEILDVQDYETTLAFEGKAKKSFEVEKLPFPIPDCLRTADGKVRGEFFITLVYQPDLNASQAFEYCQVDLQVGFGEISEDGFNSKVPPKKESHMYEEELVKNGDKWSPVKVYQKRFPRGVDIENWRLRVKVLDRDGYEAKGVEVPFTILLTIRDIDKKQPVYNEMVNLMDAYNWIVSDLVIDQRIPLRTN